MPEFTDLYVLSAARNRPAIEAFLREFGPEREESAGEYFVPQYSRSPSAIFRTADELIDYCCRDPRAAHSAYWRVTGGTNVVHVMVFFLPDGHVIFGVSTEAGDKAATHALLQRLKQHLATEEALLRYEECPPETADAFRRELRNKL